MSVVSVLPVQDCPPARCRLLLRPCSGQRAGRAYDAVLTALSSSGRASPRSVPEAPSEADTKPGSERTEEEAVGDAMLLLRWCKKCKAVFDTVPGVDAACADGHPNCECPTECLVGGCFSCRVRPLVMSERVGFHGTTGGED